MNEVKNIVLSGMPVTNGNRGVGALAMSTIFLVNQVAKKNKWKINFFHLGRSESVDVVEFEQDCIKIKNVLYNRFNYTKGFIWHILHPNYLLSELNLRKMDFLLDISGGDSYSDIYGKDRFFQMDSIKRLFRFYNIPQLMLPQTIGPFKDENVKKDAVASVESTNMVLSRDKMSYEWVINNTKQTNIKELIDVAFFLPYTRMSFDKTKTHIGFNVSALLWYGGYTKNNQFGLNIDYKEFVFSLIKDFIKQKDVIVHLIPHVVGLDEYGVENDYHVATLIKQQIKDFNLIVAPFFFNPIEAKNYISGMDFFIGARMHSCIAAFSSGVPVVPMAYSRKFNGLFEETLNYPYVVDMKVDIADKIADEIMSAFHNRDVLRELIENKKEFIEKRRIELLSELEKFLGGK